MDKRQKAEQEEADLLAEKGFSVEIGNRKVRVKPLTFGVIAQANRYAVGIRYNVESGGISEILPLYDKNMELLLNFIAVCILGQRANWFGFRQLYVWWLRRNIRPGQIMPIVLAILQMYDMANFISSIRILSEMTITTPRKTERIDG